MTTKNTEEQNEYLELLAEIRAILFTSPETIAQIGCQAFLLDASKGRDRDDALLALAEILAICDVTRRVLDAPSETRRP